MRSMRAAFTSSLAWNAPRTFSDLIREHHVEVPRSMTGELQEAQAERPWAGLAEWLRAAHSLLDDKTAELARNPD